MEEVQKPVNPKCNIALSAPCKTDNLNPLLGWVEELQTVRKQYQEAEMRLTELQNKYQVAKKIARRYILWADGKEQHMQQEWQHIVVGLQNVLQVVQAKALAALTDSAVTDSAAG
jgi:DNA-binding ferritin-like protein (Dps family)